ncbi:MAG TPA: carboxypeptidase regulatory-like domain-containing protein [Candidatus Acidoferrales bacterium]|nr:carboxypeptidase regulatory-like domain-containing protein [Candidatus Acidoferrales bacterium]
MNNTFSFLVAILLAAVSALAQSTGTIRGTLTDDSGAVIPAANVAIVGTGAPRTVQTQADGSYTATGLVPGTYHVRVNFPGFQNFDKQVAVSAGGTVTVPIQMQILAEKQEVTVAADSTTSVSVEPDNNATALVLKGEDLAALPDDPDDLADALQALAGPGAGPNGGSIYIDGFSGGQLPPKESIREIRINQNPFSAEYDRLGFGRIEILTKPGTDHIRGSAYFNYSNAIFNSRNPFASNKPDYSNRNFGGNIGGPINKRASYFLDFQRRDIQDNAITNAFLVDPTTYAVTHLTNALVTPLANTTISPRLDYQLTTNNTLTVRMEERLNSRDNQGLGGYVLPPPYNNDAAYNISGNAQNLMVTETAILNPKVVNETRFQFTRTWTEYTGNYVPTTTVSNQFTTGGNGIGARYDLAKHFELQNYTSISHGTHTIRFGVRVRRESDQNQNPQGFNGRFLFSGGALPALTANFQPILDANGNPVLTNLTSLDQYIRNLQLTSAGYTPSQIQLLGGGPSQFSIQAGEPYVSLVRWDAGPFVQDDWRVKPNLTLSFGLRYEVQNLTSAYSDIAPRFGFAWAPGSPKNGRQKTVIRGGFGIFYDRVGLAPFETAMLNNGSTQLEYTVYNPTFYPNIPPLSTLSPAQNAIYTVDSNLRADYSMQGAIGVERQLPKNSTMSVTYTVNRSNHLQQTIPINTPLPGTYNPLLPRGALNGIFPYGYGAGNLFEYESGGILHQRILMVSFSTRFNRRVSLQGNYQYMRADDLPSSPTNPYDFAQDWGRSNLDRHHNFTLFGGVQGPMGLFFSPFITLRSGAPYDVLLGQDVYGNTQFNARPVFAPSSAACGINGVVCTTLGDFQTSYNLANPNNLVPRNYLTMAGLVSVNMRVQRVFGFGPSRSGAGGPTQADMQGRGPGGGGPGGGGPRGGGMGGPGGGGGMRMGPMGGGRGGFGGGASSDHRYTITLSANFTNILNHNNPGGYQGVLTSTQFGEPTTVNTGFGGGFGGPGGFAGSMANNRRIELSMRFSF